MLSVDKTNTPEEIVDVVDENDQVIGQATKGEVNSNPKLIHREISVLIYDDNRRVLLQKRSRKKKTHPLYWIISVAGHIPTGMTPELSAHKELTEELGFDTSLLLYEKILLRFPNETHFCYSYVGKLPPGTQIKLDPNEAEDFRFVNAAELQKMINTREKVEETSLADFQKFFEGDLNGFIS